MSFQHGGDGLGRVEDFIDQAELERAGGIDAGAVAIRSVQELTDFVLGAAGLTDIGVDQDLVGGLQLFGALLEVGGVAFAPGPCVMHEERRIVVHGDLFSSHSDHAGDACCHAGDHNVHAGRL